MNPLFNFGFSQEDEMTEAAALRVEDGVVLSVASAGDTALSLLALGAREVIAVDISEPQLHLCRLKAAAVKCLDREDAAALLGFTDGSTSDRQRWLAECVSDLPSATAEFWRAHEDMLRTRGAIWCGRYEQFIRRMQLIIRPLLGRGFGELVQCTTASEQRKLFDDRIGRPWLNAFFRVAFHPRIFSRFGMDPQSLEHRQTSISLGDQYWAQFRSFCIDTPAPLNPWLQMHTIGRLASLNAVPSYLTSHGFAKAKEGISRLRWVRCDLLAYVRDQLPPQVNKVHLSNLPDWFGAEGFERILYELAGKLEPQSRLVWRYLHVNRPLPGQLSRLVHIDDELGRRLRQKDRFPFYTIVPAQIA
jgi:S-adenosylmethionine-diacylglycerol 3-amino-3-carboxypropyl transferase